MGDEVGGGSVLVVGEIEAGGDGAAEEGDLAVAEEASALPDAGGNGELDVVACLQIWSKSKERRAPVGEELEHFDGVAEVEVEELVGGEAVHLRECAGLKQVVDGCGGGAGALGRVEGERGGVGAAKEASLNGVGLELEELLDLGGCHASQSIAARGA